MQVLSQDLKGWRNYRYFLAGVVLVETRKKKKNGGVPLN